MAFQFSSTAFLLFSTAFCFPQWLPALFNGLPIFLNGFPLSKKSEKIYLRQQVYKRSLFKLCISRHLLPKLCNSRYNVYISPTTINNTLINHLIIIICPASIWPFPHTPALIAARFNTKHKTHAYSWAYGKDNKEIWNYY